MSEFEWGGRCLCEVGERPAEYGAYVCGRSACRIALVASAAQDPNLELCIKWGMGTRTTIRADLFVSLLADTDGPDITPVAKFLNRDYEPYTEFIDGEPVDMGQYVREIFVTHDEARDGAW